MLCVIPGVNIKVFSRAIHALSKIGDEIYFEASMDALAIRTVNSSRSAFATFSFKSSFFIKYHHKQPHKHHNNTTHDEDDDEEEGGGDDDNDSGGGDDDDADKEDSLKCKVYTKSLLTIFKLLGGSDKVVDRCRISLNQHRDRFVFTLICRYGVVKTFKLTYIECEKWKAVFDTSLSTNHLSTPSKLLTEVMGNFQQGVVEVALSFHSQQISLTNQETSDSGVKTEVVLHSSEFEDFSFREQTTSVFCLKEFKAFLFFCEMSNMQMSMYADEAGRPIIFSLQTDPSFEFQLVLATVSAENMGVVSDVPSGADKINKTNKTKRKKGKKNIEKEDDDDNKNGDDDDDKNDNDDDRHDILMDVTTVNDVNDKDIADVVNDDYDDNDGVDNVCDKNIGDDDVGDDNGNKDDVGGDDDDDVGGDDDDDMVEASPTKGPPNKKFKSLFTSLSQSQENVIIKVNNTVFAQDSDSD